MSDGQYKVRLEKSEFMLVARQLILIDITTSKDQREYEHIIDKSKCILHDVFLE